VAQSRRHDALFGPAAIAVHDDGNVLWQRGDGGGGQQRDSI
jgi:hypothetical protein